MEDKSKLFVFEKKEVFLLFLFLIVTSILSFVLGVHVGKGVSSSQDNKPLIAQEKTEATIKLESVKEEEIKPILEEKEKIAKETDEHARDSLSKEFDELMKSTESLAEKTTVIEEDSIKEQVSPQSDYKIVTREQLKKTGKYTIQLGSYSKLQDAKDFADGFSVRGHDPIINEVEIKGKGTWYRVGLGVFKTTSEAREYIKKEESLFQGQNYVISEIK